ncbi:MAG: hypothetical protein EXS16_05700 [Gemmataceae bacterium]|nr:hypothetical protein [Gemmataceae bacterium]
MSEPNSPKPGTSSRVEITIVGAFMFGVARLLFGLPIVLWVQSFQNDATYRRVAEASWWVLISASIAAAICGGLMCAFIKGPLNQLRGATIGLVTGGVSYIGSAIGGAIFSWYQNESGIDGAIFGAMLCGTASVITTSSIVIPGMASCGVLLSNMIMRERGGSNEDRQRLK